MSSCISPSITSRANSRGQFEELKKKQKGKKGGKKKADKADATEEKDDTAVETAAEIGATLYGKHKAESCCCHACTTMLWKACAGDI